MSPVLCGNAEPANTEAQLALRQVGLLRRLSLLPPDALHAAVLAPDDVEVQLAAADAELANNQVEAAFSRLVGPSAVIRQAGQRIGNVGSGPLAGARTRWQHRYIPRRQEDPMHRHAIRTLTAALLCVAGCLVGVSRPVAAAVPPQIVYTYQVRGLANTSSLESFAAAAASTYADRLGWNLGGSIAFRRVASGGNFTLWLAAASRVPGFGWPCDSTYSCRVGRNVVVNETRWLTGSPSWNATGASLAGYRRMVLNHETGHWLGFGHGFCGGSGQLAPVMQQQSISMQGCRPNAWPTVSERRRLAVSRGVPDRAGNPVGRVDDVVPGVAAVSLRGWAIDSDTAAATRVTIQLDSSVVTVRADSPRADVGSHYPGYGSNHGFRVTLNAAPGWHTVCVRALNAAGLGATVSLGCRTVFVSGSPIGHLDSAVASGQGILVTGWALDPNSTAAVPVAIYERPEGRQVSVWANQTRLDVAAHYPRWGAARGFKVLMPAGPGLHGVCVYARNIYGIGSTKTLGCRSVSVPG